MSMRDDPSALWGSVVTAMGALIALLVAFGVDLTPDQVKAALAFLTTLGPLLTALLIRRRAWKPTSVREVVEETAEAGHVPAHVAAELPDPDGQVRHLRHGP